VLIIVNPVAGWSWSTRRRLARVTAALERRGCTVTQRRTGPGAGDAERLAREAEAGFDVVVAAGGDGTLGAVANGLTSRALERACPLALLPFGTANVLAHEIGLPRGCGALAELIANGPERPVWPGCAGSRIFMTTASSGFDAETVAAVSPRLKRWLGRGAFAWAILLCLLRYRAAELVVRADGVEHRAVAVIAARSRFYAGPFVVAPRAGLDEKLLDLVLFHSAGRLAVLRYLGTLLLGRLARRHDVSIVRCRLASVAAIEPVAVQADGEIIGFLPVSLGIADRALQLIRPDGA
jgi:YegS/Rv2252/BmrU family lipid kinase